MDTRLNHPITSKTTLIDAFTNGRERYATDPLFKSVVNQLYINTDPIQVIDSLCSVILDLNKRLLLCEQSKRP